MLFPEEKRVLAKVVTSEIAITKRVRATTDVRGKPNTRNNGAKPAIVVQRLLESLKESYNISLQFQNRISYKSKVK